MRSTGIDAIGSVPWGTHFCQFYQTASDLVDILVPYFRQGLERNEFCMWITSAPLEVEQARYALALAVPDLDDRVRRGQIEILDYRQWYTTSGRFEPDAVLQGWVQKERKALDQGYDGLRLSGNTFWLEKADWQDFTDYEAAVDDVLHEHRMLALCTYCLDRCGSFEIIDVVKNHQFALINRSGRWEIIESREHQRAEAQRRESDRRYRTLFNTMNEGFALHEILCDEQGRPCDCRFLEVNPAFERLTGLKGCEVIGRTVRQVLPGVEPHWIETGGQVALTGKPAHFESFSGDLGRYYEVMAYSPCHGQFAMLFLDITARKQTEDQLKALNETLEQRVAERTAQLKILATELTQTEQRERRRLAQVLHDHLQQLLVAAKFDTAMLRNEMQSEAASQLLDHADTLLDQSIHTSRSLAVELSPPVLHSAEFSLALQWLANWMHDKHGLTVTIQTDGQANPQAEDVRILLFQAVRELLFNVVKHARTNRASVTMRLVDPDQVQILVADDGIGFAAVSVASNRFTSGFGLPNIRQRFELAGGRMEVDSEPGQGTRVTLMAPIRPSGRPNRCSTPVA